VRAESRWRGRRITRARRSLLSVNIVYTSVCIQYYIVSETTLRGKYNMTTCRRDYILFGRFSTIIFDDANRRGVAGDDDNPFFPVRNRHPFLPEKIITLVAGSTLHAYIYIYIYIIYVYRIHV
jgi:hypothetical protein